MKTESRAQLRQRWLAPPRSTRCGRRSHLQFHCGTQGICGSPGLQASPTLCRGSSTQEDAVAEVAKAIHPVWSLLVSQQVKGQCREREQGRTDDYGTPVESAPCTRAGLYLRGGPPNSVLCLAHPPVVMAVTPKLSHTRMISVGNTTDYLCLSTLSPSNSSLHFPSLEEIENPILETFCPPSFYPLVMLPAG